MEIEIGEMEIIISTSRRPKAELCREIYFIGTPLDIERNLRYNGFLGYVGLSLIMCQFG